MRQYIVDAFTSTVFHGNQAAVCVMDRWLPEGLMMDITRENNFSETAFTVKEGKHYHLRWFTPGGEIDLCGHATLGTAYVLFRFYETGADAITFDTLGGTLFVRRQDGHILMDFPSYALNPVEVTPAMCEAFGATPAAAYLDRDLLLVFDDEKTVREAAPDMGRLLELPGLGVGITAPGTDYDCVSRFFCPKLAVDEDPVTGSVHCMIAPYWSARLHKDAIRAFQASARTGELFCRQEGARTILGGDVALFSSAELCV